MERLHHRTSRLIRHPFQHETSFVFVGWGRSQDTPRPGQLSPDPGGLGLPDFYGPCFPSPTD